MALRKQQLAQRLKEARRTRGLSQEQTAAQIGVTAKSYGEWERVPGTWPRVSYYDRISEVLGVAREHLLDEQVGPAGPVAREDDEGIRLARENNAMLRALLAHFDVSVPALVEAPADLIGVLDKPKRRKTRSSA